MIIRKMVEILLIFRRTWNRFGKWLTIAIESDHPSLYEFPHKAGLNMGGKKSTHDAFFTGKVGFRNIAKVNWKTRTWFPSFFLPCLR